jgi:hypothetical protein
MFEEEALASKHSAKPYKKNCRFCGKQRHKVDDFWEKEANASKRPPNCKIRMVAGKFATNNSNSTKKFDDEWNYCRKKGHRENESRTKKREEANVAAANEDE